MFTGLVEAVGRVRTVERGRLFVEVEGLIGADPIQLGESIAVNGCCLTAVSLPPVLEFDLSEETLRRTSLGDLEPGAPVNLERAMRADGRFGGHIVQGHVDAVGTIVGIANGVFTFEISPEHERYIIDKGSITVEGISLTVVRPNGPRFEVWVIPHTLAHTTLAAAKIGQRVNLEFDVLAKYVERLLAKPGNSGAGKE